MIFTDVSAYLSLQVVASMEIQEITRNREKFVQEIERVSNCIC